MSTAAIQDAISTAFPGASRIDKIVLMHDLTVLLEAKDIGRFKGDISPFKQTAIDVSSKLPKQGSARKNLEKDAKKKLDAVVDKLQASMERWTKRARAKEISPTRFREEMKKALRVSYLDAYKLGTRASGLVRATDLEFHIGVDEKRWLDATLKSEQEYFNKFLDAVLKGESESKTAHRIRAYANGIRSVFDSSKVLQLPEDVVIHWVLQSRNPCPDCRFLHRLSPFTRDTLPTTPKAGSTRCRSNCYCLLRVVPGKSAEVESIRRRHKNAQSVLKLLQKNR